MGTDYSFTMWACALCGRIRPEYHMKKYSHGEYVTFLCSDTHCYEDYCMNMELKKRKTKKGLKKKFQPFCFILNDNPYYAYKLVDSKDRERTYSCWGRQVRHIFSKRIVDKESKRVSKGIYLILSKAMNKLDEEQRVKWGKVVADVLIAEPYKVCKKHPFLGSERKR